MAETAVSESAIFKVAIALPQAQRAAYLDRACGDNEDLRHEVESLLAAHKPEGTFMEGPAAAITFDRAITEGPGTIIGPYKLLQEIGEGGMGVVYMAEQEQPVRRRVALKIIKPGMDSRQVIARFEAERQALAMMDHQNIARVLDAGTTASGRPYFVMELVHGVPLTKYCDDNRLTLRQRLELFVPVCQAIQHAHQKGVIHRDIKPGNILVTMYDDKPVPKVIDFGVAKAVEQRLTEKTLFTQYGTLVGTFEYMSPEQAEMNAFGVDTRSDVYSLGVLLYELLTGTTPIERSRFREAALVELVRLIKEEEPPRPSIRLSTGGGLPKFAAACRAEPGQLPKLVRGELDWIVMKCLDKDRTRRYETVNGLARDVQRYLNDEPVEACPPSASYRLHKFARKHRGLLTTAAAFAGLLLTAAILSTWLAAWAIHAQRRAADSLAKERAARQEAIDAKEKAESFSQRLSAATQFASEGISAYFRGNWAAAQERFSKAEEIEPGLNDIYIYRGMLYTTLGLWDRAAEDYDRRFQLASRANSQTCFEYALLKYVMGDKPGYRQACQEMLKQHGNSRYNNSKLHLVRSLLLSPESVGERANLVRRAEILTADWYHPWTVHYAGVVDLRAGNFERAAARFHEAIKLNTDAPARAMSYAPLAMALFHQGKTAEAEEYLSKAEQGLDVLTKDIAEGPIGSMPIEWYDWLEANLYRREATNLITGAAPAEDPRLITIRERSLAAITYGDAFTFMDAGRELAKRKLWDEAAESFSKVLDQLTPGFRASSAEMWMCLEMVQQPQLFDSLIKLRPNDPRLWHARARIFANRGEWSKAAADCARALELYRDEWSRSGGDWSRLGRMIASLTHHLAALRMLAVDESGLPDLWEIVVSEHDEVNDPVTAQMFSRACTLMTGAVTDWSIPVRLAEPAVAKEPRVAWHLFALGAAQYRAGQTEAAIQTLRKSLEVHPTWVGRGQNYVVLALACQHLGRHDEAADWLAQAKTWLDETNRLFAKNQFGYAASDYMSDWLGALVLLREAEKLLAESQSP